MKNVPCSIVGCASRDIYPGFEFPRGEQLVEVSDVSFEMPLCDCCKLELDCGRVLPASLTGFVVKAMPRDANSNGYIYCL